MSEPSIDPRALVLRAAPPLAVLAAIAALVDLGINRVAARLGPDIVEPTQALEWMRWGALPRNLAGTAGLLALLAVLGRYLRMPSVAPLYVRLPASAFAGILMPTLTLALLLPRERMAPHFVLFGMFASYILACLFGTAALGHRHRFVRTGLFLIVLTVCQSFIVITIATIRATMSPGFGGPIAYFARHGGELTWLAVPLVLAPALLPRTQTSRASIAVIAGISMCLAVTMLGLWGEAHLHPEYSTVIYGAFRVAALPEHGTLIYVVVAAFGLGAAVGGLCSPDPWKRQLAAGLALWIAAGYGPRSPIQILDHLLAVLLVVRAAQSADLGRAEAARPAIRAQDA